MKTNNETKSTFVLLASYFKQLKKLNREQRGDWITAIYCYINGEPLPEMDDTVDMFFSVVQEQLDTYHERWEQTREARRIAGSHGGKATARNRQLAANAAFAAANGANQADNVYDNENVNENEIDTVNDTVFHNNRFSYAYSKKEALKEARRGMERDGEDLDAIVLEKARSRTLGSYPEPPDDDPEDPEAIDPCKGW